MPDAAPRSRHNFIRLFVLTKEAFSPETRLSTWHQMDMKSGRPCSLHGNLRRKTAATTPLLPPASSTVAVHQGFGRAQKGPLERGVSNLLWLWEEGRTWKDNTVLLSMPRHRGHWCLRTQLKPGCLKAHPSKPLDMFMFREASVSH